MLPDTLAGYLSIHPEHPGVNRSALSWASDTYHLIGPYDLQLVEFVSTPNSKAYLHQPLLSLYHKPQVHIVFKIPLTDRQVVWHEAPANRIESPAAGWSDMPWEGATGFRTNKTRQHAR